MITSSQSRIEEFEHSGFWEGLTLHELLQQHVSEHPERIALADQPNRAELTGSAPLRLTYAELQHASNHLSQELLQQGVGNGDRVIVQLPNIVELVVCYLALSQIGAIISPLPVQYGPHELTHIQNSLDARAYISLASQKGNPFGRTLATSLPAGVKALIFDDNLKLNCGEDATARQTLEEYQLAHPIDANQTITICWTSGTTGFPKGVPRSHNMWVTTGRNCIEAGDYRSGDILLCPFPLVNMASIAGFLYPFLLSGCTLVLHHPFEPMVFLQQMQTEKVTYTIVPPAMLNQLAKNEAMWNQFDFSALRCIGSGSAPLSPWMMEKFEQDYGKAIINFYGSNEGINLFSRPEDIADPEVRASMFPRFGSPGIQWQSKASGSIQTKVLHTDTGEEITEPGIAGELVIKGPTLFDGYWGDDTLEVFTEDGYFFTGDLVEICGDGNRYYRIAGRRKDIINRGGMKLSPAEIDVLLEGLPGAKEAAVCAYSDAELGERICACVVPSDSGNRPSLEDVIQFLSAKGIAKIKLPERLELFEALPRNPLGKVQRFILQEMVSA